MESFGNFSSEAVRDIVINFSSEAFPHAAIIEGEDAAGNEELARFIASAMVCSCENAPCFTCIHCRKSVQRIHPDILWLGGEQELKVDDVRSARKDAYISPNEADRKVFIIQNADKMNLQAQNAMLKILEEPPLSVVFLLLCENKDLLLPTVLSRCAVYSLRSQSDGKNEENPLVDSFVEAFLCPSDFDYFSFCMTLESLKRDQFSEFFISLSKTLCEAIKKRASETPVSEAVDRLKRSALSIGQMTALYDLSQELFDRTQYNAGNAALIAELVSKGHQIRE